MKESTVPAKREEAVPDTREELQRLRECWQRIRAEVSEAR